MYILDINSHTHTYICQHNTTQHITHTKQTAVLLWATKKAARKITCHVTLWFSKVGPCLFSIWRGVTFWCGRKMRISNQRGPLSHISPSFITRRRCSFIFKTTFPHHHPSRIKRIPDPINWPRKDRISLLNWARWVFFPVARVTENVMIQERQPSLSAQSSCRTLTTRRDFFFYLGRRKKFYLSAIRIVRVQKKRAEEIIFCLQTHILFTPRPHQFLYIAKGISRCTLCFP